MATKKQKTFSHINSSIKAYFIDLDGTLLDDKDSTGKVPSQMNIQGAKYAIKNGKHLIISTGRKFEEARPFAKKIGAKYIVSSNGAAIHDVDGNLFKEYPISSKMVAKVKNIARENQLALFIQRDNFVYGIKGIIGKIILKFVKKKGTPNYNIDLKTPRLKMILIGRKKSLDLAYDMLQKLNTDINAVYQGRYLEITDVKASKGLGDKYVATKILKIKDQMHTAHLGDTGNDASAFGHVGALIAMANADNDLMKVATHIGPNFKDGGVAKIIAGNYEELRDK